MQKRTNSLVVTILIFCYAVFFTSLIIFTKNFQPFSRKKENLTFNLEMLENVSVIAFGYNAETLPLLFYFFEFVCSGKKLCNCHSFLFSFAPSWRCFWTEWQKFCCFIIRYPTSKWRGSTLFLEHTGQRFCLSL